MGEGKETKNLSRQKLLVLFSLVRSTRGLKILKAPHVAYKVYSPFSLTLFSLFFSFAFTLENYWFEPRQIDCSEPLVACVYVCVEVSVCIRTKWPAVRLIQDFLFNPLYFHPLFHRWYIGIITVLIADISRLRHAAEHVYKQPRAWEERRIFHVCLFIRFVRSFPCQWYTCICISSRRNYSGVWRCGYWKKIVLLGDERRPRELGFLVMYIKREWIRALTAKKKKKIDWTRMKFVMSLYEGG